MQAKFSRPKSEKLLSEFKTLSPEEATRAYKRLYSRVRFQYLDYAGFDLFNRKVMTSSFAVVDRNVQSTVWGWIVNQEPQALVTLFTANHPDSPWKNALGNFLISSELGEDEIRRFLDFLKMEIA